MRERLVQLLFRQQTGAGSGAPKEKAIVLQCLRDEAQGHWPLGQLAPVTLMGSLQLEAASWQGRVFSESSRTPATAPRSAHPISASV